MRNQNNYLLRNIADLRELSGPLERVCGTSDGSPNIESDSIFSKASRLMSAGSIHDESLRVDGGRQRSVVGG